MDMSEKKAREILDFDDDHEFWRSDTAKTIVKVKKEMIANDIGDDMADGWIQSVFNAAKSEYGD
jgi:hypothetical protein